MNSDLLSSDVPVRPSSVARDVNGLVGHADLLERERGAGVCWRGSADEAAGALRDLMAIAALLARRGLRATVSIEPTASGELLAGVSVAG